jgi:integrase/recombinase XerD
MIFSPDCGVARLPENTHVQGVRSAFQAPSRLALERKFSFLDGHELAQYISIQKENGAVYLFESNRMSRYTTRWIREIVKKYAKKAGITKRIHPHLFRHQILTYLTSKGIVDEKIQLISGHKNLKSLNIYQDLSIADIEKEYWAAMKDFPI